ncbi:reverse transcriptase domain-containing protein [Tanacetum coccineum]
MPIKGATYQRLVDTIFKGQIGRNLEAYVDDMVIKSKTESDLIKDIEETLLALKKVNMKLNPKKCSFRMEEGKFLGYIVTYKGIRVNLKKTKAVMSMPSPNNLKQMQSMSGKLVVEINLRRLLELGKNNLSLNEYPDQLGSFGP